MKINLLQQIKQLNPWIEDKNSPIINLGHFYDRGQAQVLLNSEWDNLCTILLGPRRAGKTTLAKFISSELLKSERFNQFLYLNCDFLDIRNWLRSPLFISEA